MTTPRAPRLEHRIKAQAYGLGFDLAGIAPLGIADSAAAFDDWIANGYAGDMAYLERRAEVRRDSRLPVPGATSAVVVGLGYGGREPSGPVARYARGDDYHDVMLDKLRALHASIESELGRRIPGKAYVDTGPVLERDLARRAGLGWLGKNTMLLNPRIGSYFFIGSLLLDLDLAPDAPFATDHCGRCTRCLDACPTQAFTAPHVLDSRRCISYLTIEYRGEIPVELRPLIGELLYGCDVCQEVCPFSSKFSRPLLEPAFAPRPAIAGKDARMLAREFLSMSPSEYSTVLQGSPMKRAKLGGLKRNAAIVLGNVGTSEDVPSLVGALSDSEPAVRSHAAWALARIGSPDALAALRARLSHECDDRVLQEVRAGLSRSGA
ncbi:MAG TPA: tRNA epoxyqueuosine(34) reductase QueG [Gemmatimonadaceae bacterium]|nr:tRNA epoxyqueuosine(34) reductase QueG [Gemmatimonadaceae bacterium]